MPCHVLLLQDISWSAVYLRTEVEYLRVDILGFLKLRDSFCLFYRSKASEGASLGSVVTSIAAFDEDAGPNAKMIYSIISGNDQGNTNIITNIVTKYCYQILS